MEKLDTTMLFAFSVGITISVDIIFYTLAKATTENLDWRNLTIPVTTAHVVLMGSVVGMFYILGHTFHFLVLPLGLLGTLIISRYLYELTNVWRGVETNWSLTKALERRFGDNPTLRWLTASILAMSWDCIPVAAGIAPETNTWTLTQLLVGLIVIGATVAVSTQTSLIVSYVIKRASSDVGIGLKTFGKMVGNWAVLSLLGGFLFLAFAKGFSPWSDHVKDLGVLDTLPISAYLATVFFAIHWRALWTEQANEIV